MESNLTACFQDIATRPETDNSVCIHPRSLGGKNTKTIAQLRQIIMSGFEERERGRERDAVYKTTIGFSRVAVLVVVFVQQ